MTETRTGGCLCGAVTYTVTGPMRPVIACHCRQCRRTSGHHVAATAAPREAVAISGTPAWFASSATARRGFCGACGSNLFWDSPDSATLSIFAGTLDDATGLALAGHIFTDDKGAYYAIDDGLPSAGGFNPALTTRVPKG